MRSFISCQSSHVKYILECSCGLQYIGVTTRQLSKHISKHINKIIHFKPSDAKHFKEYCNKNAEELVIYGIDKVEGHWRDQDKRKQVSQNEMKCIYTLDTLTLFGLYIDINSSLILTRKGCFTPGGKVRH